MFGDMRKERDDMLARMDEQAKARALARASGYNPYESGAGRKRKHHKKRGGITIAGIPIPLKPVVEEFVKKSKFLEEEAPFFAGNVTEDFLPSNIIKRFDVKKYVKPEDFGGSTLPQEAALEFQDGLVAGLQYHGIGRRRRVGRPSLQSKRARARHVGAKKRHAKFAHKKVNKKRHSKPKK